MIFVAVSPTPPITKKVKKAAPSDSIWLWILGGVLLVAALHFLSNRTKKGLLVTAQFATNSHLQRSKRSAAATIGKPSPTNAAYYISEPIGRKRAGNPLTEIKRARVVLPSINRGVLVVGGPGSGKTASLIDPALLSAIDQGFSIALFDFKFGAGGQTETILPYALKNGYEARILAPGFDCSDVWNPLDQLKDENDLEMAREVVSIMVANTMEPGAKQDPFFDTAGESVITAAFLLAKAIAKGEGDSSLANMLMVAMLLRTEHLGRRIAANGSKISSWAELAAGSLISSLSSGGKNEAEAGILSTAANKIAPMILPNYLSAMCGSTSFPGFRQEDKSRVDGKQIVIFGVDKNRRASTLPIIATALQQIVTANLGRKRESPLVISLDEFPTLNLKIALNWLNEDRSNGASLIIGCQYLGQLDHRYGKELAMGFRAGCATKVWFNPGEVQTAEVLSKTLGEAEVQRDAKSKNYSGKGGTSRSVAEQLHKKALVEPHTIMELPPGHCFIQSPGVGDREKVGTPFKHEFKLDAVAASANDEESREIFAKLKVYLSKNNANIDYGEEARRYSKIIDKWLPFKPEEEKGGKTIEGVALKEAIEQLNIEAEVDPNKKYLIPRDWIEGDGEEFKLSREKVKSVLLINNINFLERSSE